MYGVGRTQARLCPRVTGKRAALDASRVISSFHPSLLLPSFSKAILPSVQVTARRILRHSFSAVCRSGLRDNDASGPRHDPQPRRSLPDDPTQTGAADPTTMPNMLLLLLTLGVFSILHRATAAPTLVYPVAEQLPVIARVGTAYDFRLLYNTFITTTAGDVTYETSTLPSWLAFDATTLSFSGIPADGDVGTLNVTLTATDTSATTTTFSILVTDTPSPAIHQGFSTQIRNPRLHQFNTAQPLPSGQGVYIHPYYSFSMGFQQSTFRPARNAPASQEVYYAAHLRGHTTLPPWLKFDNETVTFSGTAPAAGSYTIVVTGTDVWGYTAIENSFVIEVGTAYVDVSEDQPLVAGEVVTTAGSVVKAVLDLKGVTVNGKSGEVEVEPDLTEVPWLRFDR